MPQSLAVGLHQGLLYLMQYDKCSCDKLQNLKFLTNLLILLHMVKLYCEGVDEVNLNLWRLRPLRYIMGDKRSY